MPRTHHHPCAVCGVKTECPGEWERNHDGWPAVVCTFIHQPGGVTVALKCETCAELKQCEDCGEFAPTKPVEDADDASGYRGAVELCEPCEQERRA